MLKLHNLVAMAFGLLFLAVLQTFSNPYPIFRFLLPAFLAFLVLVVWYNYKYLKKIEKYNFWIIIRPVLLILSGFGIFLLLPSTGMRNLFLISGVLLISFFESFIGKFAEELLINEILIIAFGAFVAILGASFYIPPFAKPYLNVIYLIGIFSMTVLISRSFYEFTPVTKKTKLLASIILGLLCSEFLWVLSFLQFHYSVLAFLLFNLFYFCLILNYHYYFNTLNIKKIQFHLIILVISGGLALLATPWKIIQ
ncbi:MAG: hypothetical protein NTX98_00140 [Candidatus Doudnabacteria bacterium]|nr:hypothetical protein [Candidatus Doudnabacteria bacterium]